MSLPAADDLFRPTGTEPTQEAEDTTPEDADHARRTARKRSSGRVRHDEKMTVYVTSDELLELEHARLALRRNHAIAVDRGRLVREAIALVLADFEANGDASALVARLAEE